MVPDAALDQVPILEGPEVLGGFVPIDAGWNDDLAQPGLFEEPDLQQVRDRVVDGRAVRTTGEGLNDLAASYRFGAGRQHVIGRRGQHRRPKQDMVAAGEYPRPLYETFILYPPTGRIVSGSRHFQDQQLVTVTVQLVTSVFDVTNEPGAVQGLECPSHGLGAPNAGKALELPQRDREPVRGERDGLVAHRRQHPQGIRRR